MKANTKLLTLGLALSLVGGTTLAQDILKVAPKKGKVLLENDRVRVIDFREKAGGKTRRHSHPAHLIYAFTSGKAKFTDPSGKVLERELKAGEAIWNEAVSHATENISTTEAHVLIVELKTPPKQRKPESLKNSMIEPYRPGLNLWKARRESIAFRNSAILPRAGFQ